jgi:O-antigen/teichoic acid export membrane protein
MVLFILAIANFFNISFGSVGVILKMTGRHVKVLWMTIIHVSFTLSLMFILIPNYGVVGAALAVGFGKVVNNIMHYFILYSEFKMFPYKAGFWKIFLSILMGGIFLYLLFGFIVPGSGFYFLMMCFIITFVVFLITARVFCFSLEDKAVFKQLWNKISSKVK